MTHAGWSHVCGRIAPDAATAMRDWRNNTRSGRKYGRGVEKSLSALTRLNHPPTTHNVWSLSFARDGGPFVAFAVLAQRDPG
jgi:hypothetical protein